MAPRLRVFVTSDGLTDYVVATTSKAKALSAWGVHQDVFKTGLAHEADDPELVAAASAKPGEVLRRPASTRGELAKLKPAKAPKRKAEAKPEAEAKPKAPSKAALAKVAGLERRLAELGEAHERALADLARARADLDRQQARLEADHADRRSALEAKLNAARQALG